MMAKYIVHNLYFSFSQIKRNLYCLVVIRITWLVLLVGFLPYSHKVPGLILGFAKIPIFVQPSFPPKLTQLSILPG